MPPKSGSAVPTDEERLIEYAGRLKHHRDGRLAIWVHISALARVLRRRTEHLSSFTRNILTPMVKERSGEIFTLPSGDVVAIMKAPSERRMWQSLFRLDYGFAKEGLDARGEDGSSYYEIIRMESSYDAFAERVASLRERKASQASDNGVIQRSFVDRQLQQSEVGADPLLEGPETIAKKAGPALDLDGRAVLESAPGNLPSPPDVVLAGRKVRLTDLIRTTPFFGMDADGSLSRGYVDVQVKTESLAQRFDLKTECATNRALTDRLKEECEAALLNRFDSLGNKLMGRSRLLQIVIRASLSSFMRVEFLKADQRISRTDRAQFTLLLPYGDWQRNFEDADYFMTFARDQGYQVGLSDVPLRELGELIGTVADETILAVPLYARDLKSTNAEDWRAIKKALRMRPEQTLMLEGLHTGPLYELARLLDARILSGRFVERQSIQRSISIPGRPGEAERPEARQA